MSLAQAPDNPTTQARMEELERENASLKLQLARLQKIPKPEASLDLWEDVSAATFLEEERFRNLTHLIEMRAIYHLDWTVPFEQQNHNRIQQLHEVLKRDAPVLDEYEDMWPVDAVSKIFFGRVAGYAKEAIDAEAEFRAANAPRSISLSHLKRRISVGKDTPSKRANVDLPHADIFEQSEEDQKEGLLFSVDVNINPPAAPIGDLMSDLMNFELQEENDIEMHDGSQWPELSADVSWDGHLSPIKSANGSVISFLDDFELADDIDTEPSPLEFPSGSLHCIPCGSADRQDAETIVCAKCGTYSHVDCVQMEDSLKTRRAASFTCVECLIRSASPEKELKTLNSERRYVAESRMQQMCSEIPVRTSPGTLYVLPVDARWSAQTVWAAGKLVSYNRSRVGTEFEFVWAPGIVWPKVGKKMPVKKFYRSAADMANYPLHLADHQIAHTEWPWALRSPEDLSDNPVGPRLTKIAFYAAEKIQELISDPNSTHPIIVDYNEFLTQKPSANDEDYLRARQLYPTSAVECAFEYLVQRIHQKCLTTATARPERTMTLAYAFFQCLAMQDALGEVFDLSGHMFTLWKAGVVVHDDQHKRCVATFNALADVSETVDLFGDTDFTAGQEARIKMRETHIKWIEEERVMFVRATSSITPPSQPAGCLIHAHGIVIRHAKDLVQVEAVEAKLAEGRERPKPKPMFKLKTVDNA
uniref:PHD-type domain-containing protein n=1 Tax=Mycena chlorophos TaxID=658473 RepID=A0ABQ0LEK4_MYCCL|nr:predicted protein [Mycena chlorophos]